MLCLQRPGCVEKASTTLKQLTDVTLEEYVPERFLCSGGSSHYQDAVSCKGADSGDWLRHICHSLDGYSNMTSLFAQATPVDPCSYKRDSATFRSAAGFFNTVNV